MKTIYAKISIQVNDDADVNDVIENCEYSFTHDQIIDTEIVDFYSYQE